MNPEDVPDLVSVQAWRRWLLWKKTQDSREANDSFGTGSAMNMTPEQTKLMGWAMTDGEY